MDNVHFSLDNYDLPLCNFTRMALMVHFERCACKCVCVLYETIGSVRFVYGAVRKRMTVGSQSIRANAINVATKKKEKNSTRIGLT